MNVYKPRRSPFASFSQKNSSPSYRVFSAPLSARHNTYRSTHKRSNNSFLSFSLKGNTFFFQVIALFVLSVSLLLSFQSLVGISTTSAQAQQLTSDLRIYNNFQQQRSTIQRDQSQFIAQVPSITQQASSQPATASEGVYTVQSGDTVVSVAQKFSLSVEVLATLNNLTSKSQLNPGDQIRLK